MRFNKGYCFLVSDLETWLPHVLIFDPNNQSRFSRYNFDLYACILGMETVENPIFKDQVRTGKNNKPMLPKTREWSFSF